MKFLIVEDTEDWQDTLNKVLTDAGGDVVVVNNVDRAMGLLRDPQQVFNHVISDGIEGDWVKVYDIAQERGVAMTLISTRIEIARAAKKLGIPFIYKETFDNREFRERYLPSGGTRKEALK